MSDSLRPHGLQDARPPCPSPTPRVYSNSCTLSRWCHPTISSSVIPFSSCLQSFPASGSFQMSQLFASGGQSIGASALVLPMNIQGWFPLGLTGLNSLLSKGLSGVFSTITIWKQQFLMLSLFYGKTLTSTHNYWKKHSIDSVNSVSQSCLTLGSLWTAERQASLYKTSSQTLLKLMSIKSVMPSNPLILCHPLLLLPSIFHSIRVSSNELVLHIRWPK